MREAFICLTGQEMSLIERHCLVRQDMNLISDSWTGRLVVRVELYFTVGNQAELIAFW